MKYIIIYDMPREKKSLLVKINRALKSIKAEKIQHSVWESENLSKLKDIANIIKEEGGKALILQKKLI